MGCLLVATCSDMRKSCQGCVKRQKHYSKITENVKFDNVMHLISQIQPKIQTFQAILVQRTVSWPRNFLLVACHWDNQQFNKIFNLMAHYIWNPAKDWSYTAHMIIIWVIRLSLLPTDLELVLGEHISKKYYVTQKSETFHRLPQDPTVHGLWTGNCRPSESANAYNNLQNVWLEKLLFVGAPG